MLMKKISNQLPEVSRIGLGCMRLTELADTKAVGEFIDRGLDLGINFFDHADIYGVGKCEEIFGEALTPERRNKMVIQTKCAIRPGVAFDFSKAHILASVDGSLKRLKTDHIDILLLHRPDALYEPEEVADAFRTLKAAGKVTAFGVSNENPWQMELLQSELDEPLVANQIQFSIAHCPTIDAGLTVNMGHDNSVMRDGGILDYCRLKKITPQAWSPFQYGMFEGVFIGSEKYTKLNEVMERLAEKYGVTVNAIAIAWILRHPSKMQAIIGSMSASRIEGIAKAADITLTRDEWYELYLAAGKILP